MKGWRRIAQNMRHGYKFGESIRDGLLQAHFEERNTFSAQAWVALIDRSLWDVVVFSLRNSAEIAQCKTGFSLKNSCEPEQPRLCQIIHLLD